MSSEATEFVTSVPTKSIKTCIGLLTGSVPNKADAALAFVNLQSYAYGSVLGEPTPPTFGNTPAASTKEDAVKTLEAMLPDDTGTKSFGKLGDGKLLAMIQTVLPLLLKLLV